MRRPVMLLGVLTLGVLALGAIAVGKIGVANAKGKIRLAQTSAVTTCMMICNGQFANCQSSCIVSGTLPSGTSATSNANPQTSASCISSCTNQELQCQVTCAQSSPSQ